LSKPYTSRRPRARRTCPSERTPARDERHELGGHTTPCADNAPDDRPAAQPPGSERRTSAG
jgi:hypothetical protein